MRPSVADSAGAVCCPHSIGTDAIYCTIRKWMKYDYPRSDRLWRHWSRYHQVPNHRRWRRPRHKIANLDRACAIERRYVQQFNEKLLSTRVLSNIVEKPKETLYRNADVLVADGNEVKKRRLKMLEKLAFVEVSCLHHLSVWKLDGLDAAPDGLSGCMARPNSHCGASVRSSLLPRRESRGDDRRADHKDPKAP